MTLVALANDLQDYTDHAVHVTLTNMINNVIRCLTK